MILYLVTDRRRLAGPCPFEEARRCLLRQAEYAVDARIDGIIVRERDLEARVLADLTLAHRRVDARHEDPGGRQ